MNNNNFFCLWDGRFFEVGANSRLGAYSNKYGTSQNQNVFSTFLQPKNASVSPLIVGLFTDGNARFPYPFIYTSTSEITTLFYTVKPRFTPHYYGQFAFSLGKESPYIFSRSNPLNTDTFYGPLSVRNKQGLTIPEA